MTEKTPRTLNDYDDAELRAERAELVARLVEVHRLLMPAGLRGMAGDALDLDLRRAGIAYMRRQRTKVVFAIVPPDGSEPDEEPRTMDTDEVETIALSLLTAAADARHVWRPEPVRCPETSSDGLACIRDIPPGWTVPEPVRCPETSSDGLACIRDIPPGWTVKEGHPGGHMFAAPDVVDQLDAEPVEVVDGDGGPR